MNAVITDISTNLLNTDYLDVAVNITDSKNNPIQSVVLNISTQDVSDSVAFDTLVNNYLTTYATSNVIGTTYTGLIGKKYTINTGTIIPIGTISLGV